MGELAKLGEMVARVNRWLFDGTMPGGVHPQVAFFDVARTGSELNLAESLPTAPEPLHIGNLLEGRTKLVNRVQLDPNAHRQVFTVMSATDLLD